MLRLNPKTFFIFALLSLLGLSTSPLSHAQAPKNFSVRGLQVANGLTLAQLKPEHSKALGILTKSIVWFISEGNPGVAWHQHFPKGHVILTIDGKIIKTAPEIKKIFEGKKTHAFRIFNPKTKTTRDFTFDFSTHKIVNKAPQATKPKQTTPPQKFSLQPSRLADGLVLMKIPANLGKKLGLPVRATVWLIEATNPKVKWHKNLPKGHFIARINGVHLETPAAIQKLINAKTNQRFTLLNPATRKEFNRNIRTTDKPAKPWTPPPPQKNLPPEPKFHWQAEQVQPQPRQRFNLQKGLSDVIDQALPAVLIIEVRSRAPGQKSSKTSKGSGFVVTPDGYIITNHHVIFSAISNPASTTVIAKFPDGREFKARPILADPRNDVALLKIENKGKEPLPYFVLADSNKVKTGDTTITIGNSLGMGLSSGVGIVAGIDRNHPNRTVQRNVKSPKIPGIAFNIQTDAIIQPGNSGGPAINAQGEVIGITTVIIGGKGGALGFMVPINTAVNTIRQFFKYGQIVYGKIGIAVTGTPGGADKTWLERGVKIIQVEPKSAADIAGLLKGDIVLSINKKAIKDSNHFANYAQILAPGTLLNFEVKRKNKIIQVPLTVGKISLGEYELRHINQSKKQQKTGSNKTRQ